MKKISFFSILSILIIIASAFSNFSFASGKIITNNSQLLDGTYYISSTKYPNLVFEKSNLENFPNIVLGTKENEENKGNEEIENIDVKYQKINIANDGNGYCTFEFADTREFLGVQNEKIVLEKQSNLDSQKWKIENNSDGTYKILSKTNKYLGTSQNIVSNKNCVTLNVFDSCFENFTFEKVDTQDLIATAAFEEQATTRTIEDGIYFIKMKSNENKAIDCHNGSKDSCANIQLYNFNQTDAQKLKIMYKDGYYTLQFCHSNMFLDVFGNQKEDKTNVIQFTENGADNQKWSIVDLGDGSYNIISKSANKYLTVENANTKNETNIEINSKKGDGSQTFKLELISKIYPKTVENGIYYIKSSKNEKKAIDVTNGNKNNYASIQLYDLNESDAQRVKIEYDNGYYTIRFLNSDKMLDVLGAGKADKTNVIQYKENGTEAQKWSIIALDDGSYNIVSKCSNKYLTIENENLQNGTNIEINSKKQDLSQSFKIESVFKTYPKTIESGIYNIKSCLNQNKVIDCKNSLTTNCANIQLNDLNESDSQKIYVNYLGDGLYTFEFMHSSKYLDVDYAKIFDKTNIIQYEYNNGNNQKWYIQDNGNGTYKIIAKCSNKYLTIENSNAKNGANIETYYYRSDASQNFIFEKAYNLDIVKEKTLDDGRYKIKTKKTNNNNQGLYIDVKQNSLEKKSNVEVSNKNDLDSQIIDVKYIGDGYYELAFIHSDKALDCANGSIDNNTNIWQYQKNGTDAQKWILMKNLDGSFYIISKKSKLLLSVSCNGQITDGSNICISKYEENNDCQKFIFEKVNDFTLSDGLYEIESVIDNSKVLNVDCQSQDDCANINIANKTKNPNQKVIIEKQKDSFYYTLTFLNSSKVLDVAGANSAEHTNIWQYMSNGTNAQMWRIRKNEDGTISFVSQIGNMFLTIAYNQALNGSNVEVQGQKNDNTQKFNLNKLDEVYGKKVLEDGLYEISSVADSKLIGVENESKETKANVNMQNKAEINCQKLEISYQNDGTYEILFSNSEMAMDVANGRLENNNNVWQYNVNKTNAQKWIFVKNLDGSYSIMTKLGNMNLANLNSNLVISNVNNSNSQKFKIEKTSFKNTITLDKNKYPTYYEKLQELQKAHPNWKFEYVYTNLKFFDAVNGQACVHAKNLVPSNYSGEWVCSSCGTKLYDSGWYCAGTKAIAYYMDPRVFLNDSNIFQFLKLNTYDESSCTLDGIKKRVSSTFLANYANEVQNACINTNVNPYYIITRLIQEQGTNGTKIGCGMPDGDKTYYNPFNIGAYGNGYAQIYANALSYAKSHGWDTMQKALEGGIEFCKSYYLENYQNTLYTNKFNIDSRNKYALYTHQYMQNLMAASSEGSALRNMYVQTNTIDANHTFIIPIYEDIGEISQRPSNSSNSRPINVKVNATSGLNLRESANTNSNVIKIIPYGEVILSIKRGINSSWQQVVLKDGTTGYVHGSYLTQVQDVQTCSYVAHVKTNDGSGCKIRIGPSIYFDLITALPDYTNVTVIDDSTYLAIAGYDWSRIILSDGRQAFIPSRYLQK